MVRNPRRRAPLSSNWPPGSSVTLWPSSLAPMMKSFSTMGSQPNLLHGAAAPLEHVRGASPRGRARLTRSLGTRLLTRPSSRCLTSL